MKIEHITRNNILLKLSIVLFSISFITPAVMYKSGNTALGLEMFILGFLGVLLIPLDFISGFSEGVSTLFVYLPWFGNWTFLCSVILLIIRKNSNKIYPLSISSIVLMSAYMIRPLSMQGGGRVRYGACYCVLGILNVVAFINILICSCTD